jgi:hypothetical protein
MYQVTFFSKPTETGGYQCAAANSHMFYLIALTDAIIEWLFDRTIKCVTIHDKNTGKIKLNWKR